MNKNNVNICLSIVYFCCYSLCNYMDWNLHHAHNQIDADIVIVYVTIWIETSSASSNWCLTSVIVYVTIWIETQHLYHYTLLTLVIVYVTIWIETLSYSSLINCNTVIVYVTIWIETRGSGWLVALQSVISRMRCMDWNNYDSDSSYITHKLYLIWGIWIEITEQARFKEVTPTLYLVWDIWIETKCMFAFCCTFSVISHVRYMDWNEKIEKKQLLPLPLYLVWDIWIESYSKYLWMP